ncbi:MAG: carbamoyltransferase HypF [Deferribacteraceae bacterium]|jgi:hydrogenase maturation protein HypF|nr:carbamoyltransferase HypF [Deferribacteraceae bacterium]
MKSLKITISGVVQGVGFRPFTANLAVRLGVKGAVLNTGGGVEITASGDEESLKQFIHSLRTGYPPQAHIAEFETNEIPYFQSDNFEILPSAGKAGTVFIPVDIAVCPDCAHEMADPADRRYGYPFINCTQCGPRYSIIKALPYDRETTTMAEFEMCPDCMAEYDSPDNRRYHAQPDACTVCGPQVYINGLTGREAVLKAAELVDNGEIVAVKGLGGYHLICDATNSETIAHLRELKKRYVKPLAVMCAEIPENLPDAVKTALASPQAPIIITEWENCPLPQIINPMGNTVGLMPAYTPLHKQLLMFTRTKYIVATSGNIRGEPMVAEPEEAERTLAGFTSHFLHHNRKINNRIDDSVAVYMAGSARLLRRGRGYAPFPVTFSKRFCFNGAVFAAGAHLKSTITVAKGRYAFVSQYIGDLDNVSSFEFYKTAYKQMCALLRCEPAEAVCDKHDGYFSSSFAKSLGIPVTQIQHHKAHLYAAMAEHGLTDNVIGVIMDGTGYGDDGTVWGGEIFTFKNGEITRDYHLQTVPQAGGDAAVKYPSRMAQSWLMTAGVWDENYWCGRMRLDKKIAALNAGMINGRLNTLLSSSAGRLFESVGAMALGITENEFEAHSAMAFEAVAGNDFTLYPYSVKDGKIAVSDMIRGIAADIRNGVDVKAVSSRFHYTFARAMADCCASLSKEKGIKDVVLSGGVFQNKLLLEQLSYMLAVEGLNCLTHINVPANDGCISLGQAYYRYLTS